MSNNGKRLEALVATVEEILVKRAFDVARGEKRYFDSGRQEVEFDVVVSGKVGSGDIKWLIECRDRPSSGAAPAAWVEQLDGRRRLYGFSKVSAVSTTGFSEAAVSAGKKLDIDLRTVSQLDADSLTSWLEMDTFQLLHRHAAIERVQVNIAPNESAERKSEAEQFLQRHKSDALIFRSVKSGETHSASAALNAAIADQNLYERVAPDGPPVKVNLVLEYTNDDDHYVLDLADGPLRVGQISFGLALTVVTQQVPMSRSVRYQAEGSDSPIADVVSFGPLPMNDGTQYLEFHRMAEGTHVVITGMQADDA